MDSVQESTTSMARRCTTRSRTGCVACRERHIRCDEKRPSCLNCVLKKQSCLYMPKIPLRERRTKTHPGQQVPWSASGTRPAVVTTSLDCAMRPWAALDPFEVLPIKMPLRSKELLHYFFQAGYGFGPFPRNPDDCFVPLTQDPNLLQNTMLVSGLHYARNKGDLSSFEPTFLFHKIQSIRQVNLWLESATDNKLWMQCARGISTLAVSEGCLGNFEVAESHLNGLMVYLDSKRPETPGKDVIGQVEAELTNRYLILTSNVVYCMKSRSADISASYYETRGIERPPDFKNVSFIKHNPNLHDTSGTVSCLKALRMLPFFYGFVPTERKPRDVDMHPVISVLRGITRTADPRHAKKPVHHTNWNVWNSGDTPKLLFALASTHIESFSDKLQLPPQGRQLFISSWSGFCAAMGMYLTTVVGLWNQGLPIENRLHYHILQTLEEDIQNDCKKFEYMNQETRHTWFWKAFVGSLSVVHAQSVDDDKRLDGIFVKLSKSLKTFTKAEGISSWEQAKQILVAVVWPIGRVQEDVFEKVWARLLCNQ